MLSDVVKSEIFTDWRFWGCSLNWTDDKQKTVETQRESILSASLNPLFCFTFQTVGILGYRQRNNFVLF